MNPAIREALRQATLPDAVHAIRDLSGGCIHRVVEIELADGRRFVAKLSGADGAAMFEAEAASLEALSRSRTVPVAEPLGVSQSHGSSVLLMTWLPPGRADDRAWQRFGEDLAALHSIRVGARYGFEMDNHLGRTPQPNAWCDDWVTFNAEHRLGHQIRLIERSGGLKADEIARVIQVIEWLDRFIPRSPTPALLHGDLWSGNALPTVVDAAPRLAVIDPACSIGDGWADIAMMRLFGGFPDICFETYAAAQEDREMLETRIAVYQLYHVLNHVTLFGRGYAGRAMAIANALVGR